MTAAIALMGSLQNNTPCLQKTICSYIMFNIASNHV